MKQRVSKILPFHENTPQAQASALPGVEPRRPATERRERKRAEARALASARAHLGTAADEPTPQAVYHWDREDQIQALVSVRDEEPEIGFMVRLLALCALPRTNPGNRTQYKRVNGPHTLGMVAGVNNRLPYGTLPRLLLAWVCTEAVQTQSRSLTLGASLSAFMRKLGLNDSAGGARGDRTRVQNQMDRLFHATVSVVYEDRQGKASMSSLVADRTELWWDTRRPQDPVLWDSTIRLGEEFFHEIVTHPVPLDMHILKAIKRSSLGLDLYLWLTYRLFTLQRPLRLSWRQLYRQFGATAKTDPRTVNDFRTAVVRELRKLRTAWPELTFRLPSGFLELRPTPPRIPAVRADSAGS